MHRHRTDRAQLRLDGSATRLHGVQRRTGVHLVVLNDDGQHDVVVCARRPLLEISGKFGCGRVAIRYLPSAGVGRDCQEGQQCQSENRAPSCAERWGIKSTAFAPVYDLRFIVAIHKSLIAAFSRDVACSTSSLPSLSWAIGRPIAMWLSQL